MTPFGLPVEPDGNITYARWSGPTTAAPPTAAAGRQQLVSTTRGPPAGRVGARAGVVTTAAQEASASRAAIRRGGVSTSMGTKEAPTRRTAQTAAISSGV